MGRSGEVKDSHYRLKPTLLNALIIVVVYGLTITGIHILSGISYTDVFKTSDSILKGVLVPVAISSLILTIIAIWSGWWKDLWRDKYQIKDHPWMHLFLIITIVTIIGNFFAGNIGSLDNKFIIYAFIATAFVGYSEELLTRGMLIRGARGSGLTEVKVFLIVMLVFGCLHGLNILSGQNIMLTIIQIVIAGLIGGIYYSIFRKNGFLILPMILHALYDFSAITQSTDKNATIQLFVACTMLLSFILLIFAARNFNVEKTEKEEDKAS